MSSAFLNCVVDRTSGEGGRDERLKRLATLPNPVELTLFYEEAGLVSPFKHPPEETPSGQYYCTMSHLENCCDRCAAPFMRLRVSMCFTCCLTSHFMHSSS